MEEYKFKVLEDGESKEEEKVVLKDLEEIENIFRIDNLETEIREAQLRLIELFDEDPKRFFEVLLALVNRDFENEIPLEVGDNFFVERNKKECLELVKEVKRAIGLMREGKFNDIDVVSIAKLFAIEKRKADWLSENYYPKVFEKAIEHSTGDINRFLIDYKNVGVEKPEDFPETRSSSHISLIDDLSYVLVANDLASIGYFSGKSVVLRMHSGMKKRDEWKVYNTLVHELVHRISFRDNERVGVRLKYEDPSFEEINEAITELITAGIANKHFDLDYSDMKSQEKIPLDRRAYFKYILVVKTIFDRIPFDYFVEAAMKKNGLDELEKKFEEVFKGEKTLREFGENLRDLYLPENIRNRKNVVEVDFGQN